MNSLIRWIPHCKFLIVAILILIPSSFIINVFGWSNGGYSEDPFDPDYGTHDWIAQHGLDWLPSDERDYIDDNLAVYLYGTELPDNGQASDGIGDTVNHHIYFYSDGALQDDSSAVRASEEYDLALSYLQAEDYVNSAKHAGIMSHYIADVAVFGHVMGSSTDWGTEQHHSDYESYVNSRSNSFIDDFNTYLSYDGSLEVITAYDSVIDLAFDTTFDVDGDLTCLWMDENYDWSSQLFRDRCGESLNLAVNHLTDILHTLYIESGLNNHSQDTTVNLVINEFEPNPTGNDNYLSVEEWVELYNPTTSDVDISGWKISTTHGVIVTVTIPQGTVIPAGEYYVYNRGSQWLDNEDESVVLFDDGWNEVDITPVMSDDSNDGWSFQRYPNGLDTDSASDWVFQQSTEGFTNGGETPQDTLPPYITNVVVDPTSASIGTVFTISAEVSDPSGVNSVSVHIQSPDEVDIATVDLTDTDLDGTYIGTWNSTGASVGSYWVDIVATDSLDNSGDEENAYSLTLIEPEVSIHTLTITATFGGVTDPVEGSYPYSEGTTQLVSAIPSSGYVFDHWILDEEITHGENPVSITMNSDHILQAVFHEIGVSELESMITCSLSDTPINYGSSVSISGSLYDVSSGIGLSDRVITLQYSTDRCETWENIEVIHTDPQGEYSYEISPYVRRFHIRAIWSGDSSYEGCDSDPVQLVVYKADSEIVYSIDQTTLAFKGELLISGSLFPPLKNERIILLFTNPQGDSFEKPVLTSSSGLFTYSFTADMIGEWSVYAKWRGNDSYRVIICNPTSFTVTKNHVDISCSASSEELMKGESVTISGNMSPAITSIEVNLKYTKPDSSQFVRTVIPSSNGAFSDVFTVSDTGQWSVEAIWLGNETCEDAFGTAYFTVKQLKTSSITCDISTNSLYLGESVSISGEINASLSTEIALQSSIDKGLTWSTLKTVTTNPDGTYTYEWVPSSAEQYVLMATWSGNSNYLGSTSSVANIDVSLTPTTISCEASGNTITLGEDLIISGSITPPHPEAIVEVCSKYNSTQEVISAISDSDGIFNITISDLGPSLGLYEFSASWEGDASYSGDVSDWISVIVTRIPTTLSCTISPSDVTTGDTVTVSGTILPSISNISILLQYTKPDSSTLTRTVPANVDGNYGDTLIPNTTGHWNIKAIWEGNGIYEGTSSLTMPLMVKQGVPLDLWSILAIGIGGVIVIFIFLKIKK